MAQPKTHSKTHDAPRARRSVPAVQLLLPKEPLAVLECGRVVAAGLAGTAGAERVALARPFCAAVVAACWEALQDDRGMRLKIRPPPACAQGTAQAPTASTLAHTMGRGSAIGSASGLDRGWQDGESG